MRKLLLTLTILSISFFLNGPAYAQEFTNESIQGNYALNGSAGSKIVVMGVGSADGNGNMTASFIQRAFNNQRFTLEGVFTYTVNADGTGSMTGMAPDENAEGTADIVIMQAEVIDGVKLATEIFAVQDVGFLGNPVTFTVKRLPD